VVAAFSAAAGSIELMSTGEPYAASLLARPFGGPDGLHRRRSLDIALAQLERHAPLRAATAIWITRSSGTLRPNEVHPMARSRACRRVTARNGALNGLRASGAPEDISERRWGV
jgi:hypothetical protein